MFSAASLLTGTLLTLSIMGLPVEVYHSPITLPMTRRLKYSNGTNPVQRDDADIFLESFQSVSCVSVDFGIPFTSYLLTVDTGTAFTWVGADGNHPYKSTGTSRSSGQAVQRTYVAGFFAGTLFSDTVSFSNGLTVSQVPIGVASESRGIKFDGILGIGPRALTRGMLQTASTRSLPTITDCLFLQRKIPQNLVGLYLQPSFKDKDDSGVITFGGVATDPTYKIGNIAYTDTTATSPSSRYWGIDQSITYGDTEILGTRAGVVDSGCTLIYITPDAFEKYQAATGADLDPTTGFLSITLEKYDALRPLDFRIGDQTYSLVPNAQIWPRHLNYMLKGVSNRIYLVIKSRSLRPGINIILGYVFLQRFYSVFDTTRSSVGFAKTIWTDNADIN